MRKIEFFVPRAPVGKGRPRAARRGAGVVMFTPEKTVGYEGLVAATAAAALPGNALAHQLLDGPLNAVLEMRFPVPASWSKARRARALAGAEWHTSKPDADNVAKAIADACSSERPAKDVDANAVTGSAASVHRYDRRPWMRA